MAGKRQHLIKRRSFLKATGSTAAVIGLGTGTGIADLVQGMETPGDESVALKALVFTHFEVGGKTGDFPGEFQKWAEYYQFDKMVQVPGARTPVFYNDDGVGATITGMGHALCGPSVASILANPQLDLEDTYFLSAGISGTPPDVGTLGSVFVTDYVVAWDYAHRWAQEDSANASYNRKEGKGKGQEDDYALIAEPWDDFTYAYEINPALVEAAYNMGSQVSLADSQRAEEYRQNYPDKKARQDPFVDVGTTVSSEEYWHGETFSDQAQYISDLAGAGTYATTEMEDFATASALRRHGYLDQYLSLRSVSNFDQPYPGQTVRESLAANSGGFLPSLENVFRVGSALVDDIVANWTGWQSGVP